MHYYHVHLFSLLIRSHLSSFFFFFNDTATTEIYTLSLHDALPILTMTMLSASGTWNPVLAINWLFKYRSEEHTSELQSQSNLVCRLLLEKKKKNLQHILLLTQKVTILIHNNSHKQKQPISSPRKTM